MCRYCKLSFCPNKGKHLYHCAQKHVKSGHVDEKQGLIEYFSNKFHLEPRPIPRRGFLYKHVKSASHVKIVNDKQAAAVPTEPDGFINPPKMPSPQPHHRSVNGEKKVEALSLDQTSVEFSKFLR